jgi:hypothetical protein
MVRFDIVGGLGHVGEDDTAKDADGESTHEVEEHRPILTPASKRSNPPKDATARTDGRESGGGEQHHAVRAEGVTGILERELARLVTLVEEVARPEQNDELVARALVVGEKHVRFEPNEVEGWHQQLDEACSTMKAMLNARARLPVVLRGIQDLGASVLPAVAAYRKADPEEIRASTMRWILEAKKRVSEWKDLELAQVLNPLWMDMAPERARAVEAIVNTGLAPSETESEEETSPQGDTTGAREDMDHGSDGEPGGGDQPPDLGTDQGLDVEAEMNKTELQRGRWDRMLQWAGKHPPKDREWIVQKLRLLAASKIKRDDIVKWGAEHSMSERMCKSIWSPMVNDLRKAMKK